mmetsp:Transcript_77092/g.151017  ORF Transcript_77092/g.151017 Transcript_77092/m.151017 type:complete len:142 (+) Transcript_77092:103-528(+)
MRREKSRTLNSSRTTFSVLGQSDFDDDEEEGVTKGPLRGVQTGRFKGEMSLFDEAMPHSPAMKVVSVISSDTQSEEGDSDDAHFLVDTLDDDADNPSNILYGCCFSRDPLMLRPAFQWAAVGLFVVVVVIGGVVAKMGKLS